MFKKRESFTVLDLNKGGLRLCICPTPQAGNQKLYKQAKLNAGNHAKFDRSSFIWKQPGKKLMSSFRPRIAQLTPSHRLTCFPPGDKPDHLVFIAQSVLSTKNKTNKKQNKQNAHIGTVNTTVSPSLSSPWNSFTLLLPNSFRIEDAPIVRGTNFILRSLSSPVQSLYPVL